MNNDRLLADLAYLDPTYVDGIYVEGITNLGANFTMPFFRWAPATNANGVLVMERVPALLLVRPRSSLLPRSPIAALLDRHPPPAEQALELKRLAH